MVSEPPNRSRWGRWNVLALRFPKALIRKIGCYDDGDRTYPHRNVPSGDKHLPLEDETQGVSDRDDEKNCARQQGKRILTQLSFPPAENESELCGRIVPPSLAFWGWCGSLGPVAARLSAVIAPRPRRH
jgi:hypothetical protein